MNCGFFSFMIDAGGGSYNNDAILKMFPLTGCLSIYTFKEVALLDTWNGQRKSTMNCVFLSPSSCSWGRFVGCIVKILQLI